MSLPALKRRQFLEDYTEIVLSLQELDPRAAHRFCDEVEAAIKLIIEVSGTRTEGKICQVTGNTHLAGASLFELRRPLSCDS